jgi:hypothetical protein
MAMHGVHDLRSAWDLLTLQASKAASHTPLYRGLRDQEGKNAIGCAVAAGVMRREAVRGNGESWRCTPDLRCKTGHKWYATMFTPVSHWH